ncbi:hypothetical protein MIN45_P2091 [Methylomarinovum tepidoasis]|uniref:Uncharacterized protein n=1 Tax=Methylomarinovum tepidoasis TaxID=2840183 RepID=A0AAU9CTI1_9GAMM|nr:hypothetical protein [Methylomarinovum sp. IN45]BCX89718.1 hypothetical protein MIN45_P2091 [Methylomarinovum sp. IN45]
MQKHKVIVITGVTGSVKIRILRCTMGTNTVLDDEPMKRLKGQDLIDPDYDVRAVRRAMS